MAMAVAIALLMLAAVGYASTGLQYSSQVNATHCFPESWKVLEEHFVVRLQSKESCSPVEVLKCYCLTKDTDSVYSIGCCFYSCFFQSPQSKYQVVSMDNKSDTDGTCSQFNRGGVLCGQCREGYGTPVYSFSLTCVRCRNVSLWTTVPLYVFTAYGPLTVFLAAIVFFTVSVNSAPLHGWILVCQLLSSSIVMRVLVSFVEINHIPIGPYVRLLGTVYGVWNLDFFRSVYKPFCLHPSLSTLVVMSLDYLVAVYPLVLILGLYVAVDLYSRNCWPVVIVGRVFHRCCIRFRHRLDIRTSLIDAFGTFFSLSYVKFLSTSVDLLVFTRVWKTEGKMSWHVFFDGSMEFFKGNHIPFALTAVTLLVVCNILPLIVILLYSFPRTHAVLNILPASVRAAMFPFMDNILACYKDGTNATRNCRYFGVVYHFALLAYILSFATCSNAVVFGLNAFVCIVVGMLVAVIQPYKSKAYNIVDIILILGVGLCYAGTVCSILAYYDFLYIKTVGLVLAIVPAIIPFFYIVGFVGGKLFWKICRHMRHCSLTSQLAQLQNRMSPVSEFLIQRK